MAKFACEERKAGTVVLLCDVATDYNVGLLITVIEPQTWTLESAYIKNKTCIYL